MNLDTTEEGLPTETSRILLIQRNTDKIKSGGGFKKFTLNELYIKRIRLR